MRKIPKGRLLVIGGAEDKADNAPDMEGKRQDFERYEILKTVLPSKGTQYIEVITTGSNVQDEVQKSYKAAFRKLGYEHTHFMSINDKLEAREPKYARRIEKAGVVFFSGGDQFKLATIIGGTQIHELLSERYREDEDFLIAGTSAGAMVMSKVMIAEGGVNEGLLKNDLRTSSGFGWMDCCIIDTHFIKRGRFGRLAQAVVTNPGLMGIGLGEDTALMVERGVETTCVGSGTVVVIDGKNIEQTNITEANDDEPVFVENLVVHLLTKGCQFNLQTRELEKPAEKRKTGNKRA